MQAEMKNIYRLPYRFIKLWRVSPFQELSSVSDIDTWFEVALHSSSCNVINSSVAVFLQQFSVLIHFYAFDSHRSGVFMIDELEMVSTPPCRGGRGHVHTDGEGLTMGKLNGRNHSGIGRSQ